MPQGVLHRVQYRMCVELLRSAPHVLTRAATDEMSALLMSYLLVDGLVVVSDAQ